MAENKKVQPLKLTTPKGVVKYAWLTTPKTKWKPQGEYTLDLILDPEKREVKQLLEKIDEVAEAAFQDAYNKAKPRDKKGIRKNVPWKDEYVPGESEDSDEVPTGMIVLSAKTAAQYTNKKTEEVKTITVPLFDKYGKPWDRSVAIYGGSIVAANVTVSGYFNPAQAMAGATLYLNAVQVLEAVTSAGGDASQYGFQVDEVEDHGEEYEDGDTGEEMPF